jgi:hypothetical protein
MKQYTACFEDPDTWFSKNAKKIARAKEGCNSCPIRVQCLTECLEYEALSGTTKRGVYGGLTEAERINLPKAG